MGFVWGWGLCGSFSGLSPLTSFAASFWEEGIEILVGVDVEFNFFPCFGSESRKCGVRVVVANQTPG